MSRNLQREVTDRIVALLKAGTIPWRKPWSCAGFGGMPRNAITGRAYSGVNVLLLWARAEANAYTSPTWLTYKQASEAGGYVRKGERGETIIFVSYVEAKAEREPGKPPRMIPFLKAYTVFNVAQCEGLASAPAPTPATAPADRIAIADEFIAATGASIRHGGGQAFYRPSEDTITLPPFETFSAPNAYYATAFHELTHWTNAPSRLDRGSRIGRKFGDAAYSAEELVAELGSAFACAEFGFDNDVIENSAAYIAHWIAFLTEAPEGAIVTAASLASKAVEFLRELALRDGEAPANAPTHELDPAELAIAA
jgi:antirestriction protein ArdC